MKLEELEKRINERIEKEQMNTLCDYYDTTTDKVEKMIREELSGEIKEELHFETYGTKGRVRITYKETGVSGNCIEIKIKRCNTGYTGGIFGHQGYGIRGIVIETGYGYNTIEEFIESQKELKRERDKKNEQNYNNLLEEINKRNMTKEEFRELMDMYNKLSYAFKREFNDEKYPWEV